MERRALVADFAHVAEDEPARRGQRGEDVDRGADRVGVGVVAVVDQRHVAAGAREFLRMRAPAHRDEALQAAHDRLERAARRERARGRRERVAARCGCRPRCSSKVAARRPASAAPAIQWSPCQSARPETSAAAVEGERQRPARAGDLAPDSGMGVVGRGRRRCRRRRQRLDRGAVLARDRLDGRHELLVLTLRVVDEGDRRRRDLPRGGRSRPTMVHAELDDRRRDAAVAQAQQRQRQADVVVEVAFGGERLIAEPRRERSPRSSASPSSCRCCRSPRSSGMAKRRRQAAASSPRARRLSATTSPGSAASSARPCSARAATAPAAVAPARKSCASKRSPRRATNRSPGRRLRVSLCTRAIAVVADRRRARAPGSMRAARRASVIIDVAVAARPGRACADRGRPQRARRAPSPHALRPKTGASRRRCPGSPRGPCRR